jgi:hypothetical protein
MQPTQKHNCIFDVAERLNLEVMCLSRATFGRIDNVTIKILPLILLLAGVSIHHTPMYFRQCLKHGLRIHMHSDRRPQDQVCAYQ